MKNLVISKADILGDHAKPGDERVEMVFDLGEYCTMLEEANVKGAFQRRVRYVKAMEKKREEEEGNKV